MNFVALILGLGLERVLTHLFHLREFRWLDPVFDALFRKLPGRAASGVLVAVTAIALLLTLPVALVSIALVNELLQIPYFVFAVIVLLVSLGPRDLKQEVDDYCAAVDADNSEDVRRIGREIIEDELPEDDDEKIRCVERAIFVQANNRIFGVVLWFLLLGPTGAWWFRILDLMRRRIAYQSQDDNFQEGAEVIVWAVRMLHGIFAWLPARLLAAGYALAGSFEETVSGWRAYYSHCAPRFFDVNNDVLSCAGCGALGSGREADEDAPASARIRAAWNLVFRTLWLIWCPVFAILTLYNWLV